MAAVSIVEDGDRGIRQRNVAYHASSADFAKQATLLIQAVDMQAGNLMTQAIELAGKCGSAIADGRKALVAVPGRGGGRIDIAAQRIIARQIAAHALQIDAGQAVKSAEAVDDGVIDDRAVTAQLGAEAVVARQVDGRADIIDTGVAGCDVGLAVFQRQAGRAGTAHGGIDIDIVLRRQGQLVGRPGNRFVDIDVAGRAAAAVGTLDLHRALVQAAHQVRAGHVAAGGGDREVDRIDQPGAGQAIGCLGADIDAVGNIHVCGRGIDKAALATVRRAGVQRTARVDGAGLHVAQQFDAAATRIDGVRLDHAGIVDHGFQQVAGGLGREQHAAAIGLDQAAILHQRAHRAPVHRHVQQAVAGHVQRDGIAGRQGHRTQARRDRALVRYMRAQQGHIAARSTDRALVQHLARAIAGKFVVTGHKVGVVDIQGGGYQARRVDRGSLAEQHAVRVDNKHLAVGRQVAEDGRAVAAQHAVQGHRIAVGLHELHRFTLVDIELGPVDHRILATLRDHRRAWRATNIGLPRHHRAARRPRQGQ